MFFSPLVAPTVQRERLGHPAAGARAAEPRPPAPPGGPDGAHREQVEGGELRRELATTQPAA